MAPLLIFFMINSLINFPFKVSRLVHVFPNKPYNFQNFLSVDEKNHKNGS